MMTTATGDGPSAKTGPFITRRHSAWVRLTHWIWVVCLSVLLMSGLQIFNAYPALNFGEATTFDRSLLAIGADRTRTKGITTLFGHDFVTTGVLGLSGGPDGPAVRAFPRWATLPADQDLGTGRRWHFLAAWVLVINGFVYLAYGVASRHIARDILPGRADWKALPRDILDHLRLRFAHGTAARRYNVLQKLSYAGVLFVVLPVLVLAGMAMSPGLQAALPWLDPLFGGRQSARTIHFIMATLLVLFVLIHVVMVLVSGFLNNMRAMITGRYAVEREPGA